MKNIVIIVVAVLVLAVGGFLLFGGSDEPVTETQTQDSSQESEAGNEEPAEDTDEPASQEVTIVYTSSGFSPNSYTVAVGGTVTVKNEGDLDLDFASADHPTHKENSEFNLGDVAPGESKSFTVTEAGTWGFHNHDQSSHIGTLVVK